MSCEWQMQLQKYDNSQHNKTNKQTTWQNCRIFLLKASSGNLPQPLPPIAPGGFSGVAKFGDCYEARIEVNGEVVFLGQYKSAAAARDIYEQALTRWGTNITSYKEIYVLVMMLNFGGFLFYV